jgi:hypothetical protein
MSVSTSLGLVPFAWSVSRSLRYRLALLLSCVPLSVVSWVGLWHRASTTVLNMKELNDRVIISSRTHSRRLPLEQVLCHGTPRGLIVCSDASSPSSVTLPGLCSPFAPASSPTDFASKDNNTLFPSSRQHVFSLHPHFCVRRRTTALAHGIATQVVSGQVLCH